jgi:aspartate-semialdehyde dehydrogenase
MQGYHAADWISSLPSAPRQPIQVLSQPDRPQPRLDRDAENGMAAVVGRVRPCPIMDMKMTAVIHNALRGAAGGAILNAEMLAAAGYIK